MPTRHDISRVPLQGGYIAKQCPVKIQWDVIKPVEPVPASGMAQLRMEAGNQFEDGTVSSLDLSADGPWVLVPDDTPQEMTRLTVEAMERKAEAIFGGWLPMDVTGRRVGKPDILVFAGDGYIPVDIKHHLTLSESDNDGALVSDLERPFPRDARTLPGQALRKNKDDALQLAHYRRMLQACGYASDSSLGGIYGKEGVIVWYDLDEAMWMTPAKSDGKKRKRRTSMEAYDFEFDFRLDIGAVAQQHLDDAGVDLLVVPLRHGECGECGWREHCGPIIGRGSGSPTLLPRLGYDQWVTLREAGITDRAGVAGLDLETARLGAAGVDAAAVLARAAEADPDQPVEELIPRAKKQSGLLRDAGITTAAEVLAGLDARTAALGRSSFLAKAIINARAVLGPESVYRLPGTSVDIRRFDIEIDVDMENGFDGVYLWGTYVTDPSGTGLVEPGYRPFFGWEVPAGPVEEAIFGKFWVWLTELLTRADEAGVTVGAYYWTDAETSQMTRIAAGDPELAEQVGAFCDSPNWVDLKPLFDQGWTNGVSASLKPVATSAGYEWPVDEPDAGMSMVRHIEAMEGDEEARTWILDYNRGDVEATRAVREWMMGAGREIPEVPTEIG